MQVLEDREEELKCHLALLKEESAGHISHIHTLKDSNFQLTQGLEQAIEKGEMYKKKLLDTQGELDQEREISMSNEHRNKMTREQQAKLIDFLQAKLDDKMKKKKVLLGGEGSFFLRRNWTQFMSYSNKSHVSNNTFNHEGE